MHPSTDVSYRGESAVHQRPGTRSLAARAGIAALSATLLTGSAASAAEPYHENEGPSSSQTPYLQAIARDVRLTSLITVGDSVGGYRMAGIPDGIGVLRGDDDDTFTIVMNHEFTEAVGGPRDHAPSGAFVSRWTVRRSDFKVLEGRDLIQAVSTYDHTTGSYAPPAYGELLGRLCSADLPLRSAFYERASGSGFRGRILLHGEEVGAEGRAFGTVAKGDEEGTSYELPYLGKFSWENAVAHPSTGDRTVVIGLDDSTPGQVYVYRGDKQDAGNPVERAGLDGGELYGIKVTGVPAEDREAGIGASSQPFELAPLGDVSDMTGAELETASATAGVTQFLRPEDGAWDPTDPDAFYFVTTDRFNSVKRPGQAPTLNQPPDQEGRSRLWRLDFQDATQPESGGTITELLDGGTGLQRHQMFDNLTVAHDGRVLIQEDPGLQPWSARIWEYDPATMSLRVVARHDSDRFGNDKGRLPLPPFTVDEESSGIIDASNVIGQDWFVLDVQAHYPLADPTLVEGGQLLVMYAP